MPFWMILERGKYLAPDRIQTSNHPAHRQYLTAISLHFAFLFRIFSHLCPFHSLADV
jgi:hypothetical protein